MPGAPVGTNTRAAGSTALFGYIAARLNHVPTAGQNAYFRDELGIDLSQQQAERAARPVRLSPARKGQRGRPGALKAKRTPLLEEWMTVDEGRLGLEKWVVRIEGDGRSAAPLAHSLSSVPGVRQILETGSRRDLHVTVICRDLAERRGIRARFEELTSRPILWDEVLSESHAPAARTWEWLARQTATDEDRLV